MDIIIHRSLIEPLTFPWACIRPIDDTVLLEHIRAFISAYFDGLENSGTVPTDDFDAWGVSKFSIDELQDVLKIVALEEGAETAKALARGIPGTKRTKGSWNLIGFSWILEFTVPNDPRTHALVWKSWFKKALDPG
jgi:hypothetical protein